MILLICFCFINLFGLGPEMILLIFLGAASGAVQHGFSLFRFRPGAVPNDFINLFGLGPEMILLICLVRTPK